MKKKIFLILGIIVTIILISIFIINNLGKGDTEDMIMGVAFFIVLFILLFGNTITSLILEGKEAKPKAKIVEKNKLINYVPNNKFGFVLEPNKDCLVTIEEIKEFEKKYDVNIPTVLKEYYQNYNCSKISESNIYVNGIQFDIGYICSVKYGKMTVEQQLLYVKDNEHIPNTFIPLADEISGMTVYYWDKIDGKVYYYCVEDEEDKVICVCNSVDEFFRLLNYWKDIGQFEI